MLSKAQIKLLRSLQLKKYREQEGLFIAEGRKIVEELIGSSISIEKIFITNDPKLDAMLKRSRLLSGQHDNRIEVIQVDQDEFDKISTLSTPQGILAVCKIPTEPATKSDLKNELALALDDIRDPGNLGTIIRIADWFGISHIYCSEECVDAYNPKVVQASMGSIARVNVHYVNLSGMLKTITGEAITIYGALLKGKNIYQETVSAKGILVIGNESNGISTEVQKYISNPVSIPAYNPQGPESLNAAIATAVLCAELKRNS